MAKAIKRKCKNCHQYFSPSATTQPTLATLHHQILAIGSYWNNNPNKNELFLSIPRKRRTWFEVLWAKAGDLSSITIPS